MTDTLRASGLAWWLQLADSLDWTWAKTYASSAPHSYVVLGSTPGLTRDDFQRAGRVIRAHGEPGRFYGHTNIYLADPPNSRKFWTMDRHPDDTDLINRSDLDLVYGPQDAPSTRLLGPTPPPPLAEHFTAIAPDYDRTGQTSQALDQIVCSIVVRHFGAYAPTVLDVGCGTGRLLDLGLTAPSLYTGLDFSQGMLNELALKHPKVPARNVLPVDANTVAPSALPPNPDLVTALFGSAGYLTPATLAALADRARSLAIFMWRVDPDNDRDGAPESAHRVVAAFGDAYLLRLGPFVAAVVEK